MQYNNSTAVLTRFVKKLAVRVTRQSISDELQKHPDNFSLLAFSDVLDNFKVPNSAYRLPYDQLIKLPVPFITYLRNKNFAVVTHLDEKQVTLSNEIWNNKSVSIDEFNKQYGGSVLVAKKNEKSGEVDFDKKHRIEVITNLRLPVAVTGCLLILLELLLFQSPFISSLNTPLAVLALFKTAGLTTSILLLLQSINANDPLIRKFCGGDDGKSCNAILSSNAAKVTSYLNWSEVGFFYFAGTLIVLLFAGNDSAVLRALALLNILSLPYTFYSIWYQWRLPNNGACSAARYRPCCGWNFSPFFPI